MSTIGDEFGGRDHSTIVYAIQQVEKNMNNDLRYKETIEDIIKISVTASFSHSTFPYFPNGENNLKSLPRFPRSFHIFLI